MKIIHTSDWHIGKSIHEKNLLEDQIMVLENFLKVIEIEKPDAIIIAGDLYDRAIPNKEAVNALDHIFSEIVTKKQIPLLCIGGNHDSGDRLEFASRILKNHHLYIEGRIKNRIEKIEILDEYGKVNFFLIPFGFVAEIKECYPDETIQSFDDAFKVILENIEKNMRTEERNIVIAHGFIVSDDHDIEVSDSVRPLSIGTAEYVSVEHFKNFDYIALGHLHKAQKVKWDRVQYSGSLLKYSFSETNHVKSITIIDIKEKNNIDIKRIPLDQARDMKKIEGTLNNLISIDPNTKGIQSDYFMATLLDENVVYDAIGQLRAVYPNILRIDYKNRKGFENNVFLRDGNLKEKKSDGKLFKEFYEEITGQELPANKENIIEELFKEIITRGGELS